MVNIYVTSDMIQSYLTDFYFKYGKKKNFLDAIKSLYEKGSYAAEKPSLPTSQLWGNLSDSAFIEILSKIPVEIQQFHGMKAHNNMIEPELLPDGCDVFVYRHFNYIDDLNHSLDFFEICYVFQGSCQLHFEKEDIKLTEGELCIIAPLMLHEAVIDDISSVIIMISIRKSTFDSAFFSLLSQKDLLSGFFRTHLYNKTSPNYLLFVTNNSPDIKSIIKNLFMENYMDDLYVNSGSISWVNILLAYILRNYSNTIRFYNYELATDFSMILQYIQQNYHTVRLRDIADFFHYNESHLSITIKKYTGSSFTDIITNLKILDSVDYLEKTNVSIEKIAEYVGYNSADHFSRTFKKNYKCSPQQYRKKFLASNAGQTQTTL